MGGTKTKEGSRVIKQDARFSQSDVNWLPIFSPISVNGSTVDP